MSELMVKPNNESELMAQASAFSVVKSSLYPTAPDDMVKLYLEYCNARKFDPFGKAVYLIERKDKNKQSKWEIQPGVGAYRIQAVRSGEYAGLSDTIYGPTKKMKWSRTFDGKTTNHEIEYPEWAEVKIKRLVQGQICEFSSGKRFWLEEYARFPNGNPMEMWAKMPFSQLAKCAEAQALRKAFPDCVDQGASAEELEGKPLIDHNEHHQVTTKPKPRVVDITPPKKMISEQTLINVNFAIREFKVPEEVQNKWLKKANVNSLDKLTEEQGQAIFAMYSSEIDKRNAEKDIQDAQWDDVKEETA